MDCPPERTWVPTPGSNPTAPSLVGQSAGQFKLVSELGRGGMGTVYLGEHALIGSRVAVKVLHPHLSRDPEGVGRFFAEARAVNLIGHENIVRIFDMDQLPSGDWYLVMEYLTGQPLAELAHKPFPEKVCRSLLVQVLDALDAAHARGIVHRDVKPENVFITPGPDGSPRARLLDFGIARMMLQPGQGARTQPGMVLGTPAFMAPEQWEGAAVDGRADLYAVGVMGWQLITGTNPFADLALADLLAAQRRALTPPPGVSVSARLRRVLERAMAPRKEDRFATAGQFRDALLALGRTTGSVPVPTAAAQASTRYGVKVAWAGRARELTCDELSRAGAFIHADSDLPPIRALVSLSLALPGGALPCRAEVVRHVGAEEARTWRMSPGFAVQFLDAGRAFADRLAALLNPASGQREREDAAAGARVRALSARLGGDPYALLEVPPDATFAELRRRARALLEELAQLSSAPLGAESQARLLRLQEQAHAALFMLGDPQRRADFDARRGNFRGVARCLAAGLTVSEVERLRGQWLRDHEGDATRARLHRITGDLHASRGEDASALGEYEKALSRDPLDVGLQQTYWALARKVSARASNG